MPSTARRALAIIAMTVCPAAAGCGGSSSPAMTPTPARGFSGQWSGVTGQGRPITFIVTPDEKVASISVGYNFNGCSGTQTYSNLAIETKLQVECLMEPCPPLLTAYRSLAYASGDPFQGPYTSIQGFLAENQGLLIAEGAVSFRNYPGCGSAQSGWSASRR